MTDAAVDVAAMLEQLLELPAAARAERFADMGGGDDLLCALGDEAERLALVEVARAVLAAQLVVELADASGSPRPRVRARRALAQALAYAGRHDEALAACRDAVEIGAADAPIEAGRAQIASLHPLGELGRYDEAIAAGEAAYELLMRAGAPEVAARADFNLGNIFQNRHDPQRALFHFDRAAPAFADTPLLHGYLQSNRGEALLQLNDFAGAEQAFREALDACEAAGAHVAAAIAQGNLADLEARRGRLSAALTHFERARSRLEQDQADSHVARLLGEQAETLATLGAPESAQEAFEQAIELLDKHGLAAEAARARHGLGRALLRSGRLEAARQVLAEAQQRYVALGQTRAAARVELLLAEAALTQADLADARARLSQASRCLEENTLDRIALRSLDARILAASNRIDDALDALSAALEDAERFDIPPLLADLLHQRAAVRRIAGDAERELADLDHAVAQAERVRGSLQAEQLRAAALSDRLALYHDRIDAHLRRTPLSPERVFEAVEQARSRTLLDALAESASPEREAGDDPLVQRHAELRSELSILYSRLAERGDEATAPETLSAWRAEVKQRERELDELENRLAVRAGGDPLLPRPADLGDVVAALRGDGLLVEYFLARGMLHALVATGGRVTVIRDLLEADALRRHVQNLQFQIARGARPSGAAGREKRLLRDVRVELQSLYERVVAPCIAGIDHGRRICFVPAGPLHAAPLHAAWDGEAYLIERHVVHYAPSAGIYARLVQRAAMRADRSSASRPLVVGVGDENAPEIQAETHEVAEQLAAKMLWAQDATIDAVLAALPDATLAHIACHGYFSRRTPRASGLRLHDRWLTAGDLARLRLAADLVVLSGCSTGRSVVEAGEEVFGLVRGFLSAGAPRTLLTLWPAHDVQTRHFMREFYRVVTSGPRAFGSTAQAVQRAMRHGIAEAKHPFLWAPFLLVGVP